MRVIKPVAVNATTFISSTVAEPDVDHGEVEWEDPELQTEFGTYSGVCYASALGNDGNMYAIGSSGTVLKIDVVNQTVSTFGTYSGVYNSLTLGSDGNIYAVGSSGTVLKINVASQTVSTFGAYLGIYYASTLGNDGNIYAVGDNFTVVKIDIINQTVSTFGAFSGAYYASALGNDGNIYAVGSSGTVLKINVVNQTISTFGSYSGIYYASTLGNDGNIYAVGHSGTVLKINVVNQTISTFGTYSSIYRASALGNDGNIYAVGHSGIVLKINVASQTVSTFGAYLGIYYALTLESDDNIYAVGDSGTVLKIRRSYNSGDVVVISSLHKKYMSSTFDSDSPLVGITKVPPTWVYVSPTNKYSMLDDFSTTKTVGTSPMVFEIKAGNVGGLAGFGIDGATSINITMTDPTAGVVYSKDIEMTDNTLIVDWYQWLFGGFNINSEFALFDMPSYVDATVKITLTGAGDVSIGTLVIGEVITLGVAAYDGGAGVQLVNLSLVDEDAFGNVKITKRPKLKLVNYNVAVQKPNINYVYRQLEALADLPTVWSGNTTSNANDETLVYGYHVDNSLPLESPTTNMVKIQVRGLI